MRRLLLAGVVIGCGARSDLSSAPSTDAGVDTTPAAAFVLTASPTSFTITQGGAPITITVHVDRQSPFNAEVDVDIPSLPIGLSATTAVLAPGVTDASLTFSASLQSTQGTALPITLRARAASAGQETAPLNVFVRGCPGCLDTTFGVNGRTDVSNYPAHVAVDTSNHIILAIAPPTVDSPTLATLVRFDENGNADPSFGVDGQATTPFVLWAAALALDVHDRPLIGGSIGDVDSTFPEYGVALRFTADGLLDSTFGSAGSITVPTTPTSFGSLAFLPDGSFISAGETWSDPKKYDGVMWLPKVLSSGALDTTFGQGGIAVDAWQTGAGFTSSIVTIAGNQFVIGGSAFAGVDTSHFALARFNGNGNLDTTFGTNGELVSNVPGTVNTMVLTPSNHYFMCGGWSDVNSTLQFASQFAMFSPDGTLDTTFGASGSLTTTPIQSLTYAYAQSCVAQSDGKLLALGVGSSSYLLRMNADGTFDSTFATNGVATLSFDASTWVDVGPVLQSDGRIIVAGSSWSNNPSDPSVQSFLLRYWN